MLDIVEVVDNNTKCKVNHMSMSLYGAAGIPGMICGGEDDQYNILSNCWHLNPDGAWTAGNEMLDLKKDFSLNKVEDEIIAIGGHSKSGSFALRSIERLLLTNDEGWSRIQVAPITIYRHCTVMRNTSYLMIIGGNQNSQVNSNQP